LFNVANYCIAILFKKNFSCYLHKGRFLIEPFLAPPAELTADNHSEAVWLCVCVCLHVSVDSLWVVCILADGENLRQIQWKTVKMSTLVLCYHDALVFLMRPARQFFILLTLL